MAAGYKLISIEPPQVSFTYSKQRIIPAAIMFTNLTGSYVAFKVKTNAANFYLVKPNMYRLSPGEKVMATIISKANMKIDEAEIARHGFLIESVMCSSEDASISQLFQQENQNVKRDKLSVVFKPVIEFASSTHKGNSLSGTREKGELKDIKRVEPMKNVPQEDFAEKYRALTTQYDSLKAECGELRNKVKELELTCDFYKRQSCTDLVYSPEKQIRQHEFQLIHLLVVALVSLVLGGLVMKSY